ncbi:MAG: hypothetical protein LBH30_02230 [Prevotellaceae bacterium]|nr:hypothetical protein [Prevotellaceae bacterium]
MLSADLTVFP